MIVMYPATIGDLFTPANNFNWRKERCACIQAVVGKIIFFLNVWIVIDWWIFECGDVQWGSEEAQM